MALEAKKIEKINESLGKLCSMLDLSVDEDEDQSDKHKPAKTKLRQYNNGTFVAKTGPDIQNYENGYSQA